jgi:hypothetical protein
MGKLSNTVLFCIGIFFMILALCVEGATLANGNLTMILLCALAFTIAADSCLTVIVCRGTQRWRIAALLSMSPSVLLVLDFIRRAPYAF